jgi:CBS domain containing-hemolysin-like protein
MDIDRNLFEVCEKFLTHHLHRIIIMEKESQIVVGTITQRDILLFIIRNFKSDIISGFNISLKDLGWQPNPNKILFVNERDSVFVSFATMSDHKLSSIPVVDQNGKFLGFIQKSDIILIFKDDKLEMVNILNSSTFLKYILFR